MLSIYQHLYVIGIQQDRYSLFDPTEYLIGPSNTYSVQENLDHSMNKIVKPR